MRLLNTKTLALEEFFDSQIPKYAILSHRWGEKEVSYKEMHKRRAPKGPGLAKIEKFCALAAERGFKWAWIDTCCIDKQSSAELSEAINSMYQWYKRSGECYNYLADVECSPYSPKCWELLWRDSGDSSYQGQKLSERFRNSSWFTRGWTLQELLASSKGWFFFDAMKRERSIFFDAQWNPIGSVGRLESDVVQASGIRRDHIYGSRDASVAQRMSWMSHRQTSRGEDMAYCLLGIFDVNMPLLYGEGAEKAFVRLQQEIMKISDDESLFAWTKPSLRGLNGLLASKPDYFADSGNVVQSPGGSNRPPYWMTNKGLRLEVPKTHTLAGHILTLYLSCCFDGDDRVLGIRLFRAGSIWIRYYYNTLETTMYTCDSLRKDLQSTHPIYIISSKA